MTLLEELEPKLASFLNKRGLGVIEERRDDAFGNAMAVVKCDGFFLRIVRDRGETSAEFCQQGKDRWYLAENILEFITGSVPASLSDALETNFERVADLMNSELKQRGYTSFEKTKADANMKRLFP